MKDVTTQQKQKWVYAVNKHKRKIDAVVKRELEVRFKYDEDLIKQAWEMNGDNPVIELIAMQGLLNFHIHIMQELWTKLEEQMKQSYKAKESDV